MRIQHRRRIVALLAGLAAAGASAQEMRASSRMGQSLFQRNCSNCHRDVPGAAQQSGDNREAPALTLLREFTPERMLESMETGKMQPMAAHLTAVQRQQIAEWSTGRPIGSAASGDMKQMANRCTVAKPLTFQRGVGDWRGWGPDGSNQRFQGARAAGLAAADLPKLEVKWAFAAPTAIEMYSQPTVAGGRVFFSSDSGQVYALDAKTGCGYWSYQASVGVRTAPVFTEVPGSPGKYGVFFADRSSNVYGVDATTGLELWRTRAETLPRTNITGSPTIFEGKLFVGLTSGETIPAANSNYPCCTHRGGVVAIDIATGRILWKTYTIAEEPKPRGTNAEGVGLWGPAGASVWNSPTIDAKRRRIYIGTGNSFTEPAAPTTDSIMALDLDTGRIAWHHQEFSGDAFIGGCGKTNAPGGNCPVTLGPDWDFGGASMILHHLPNGRDLVIGAGKGGVAVAVDPDRKGAVVWRRVLYKGTPPNAGGLVIFGGAADRNNAYYPLQQAGGGLAAVRLSDGELLWTADLDAGPRGQAAAATAIPGVIFTGGWDGILRAVSDQGKLLWSYNTRHEYPTINGVPGKGGSLGAPGVVPAGGMLYVVSGYIGPGGGSPGNVLVALAPAKN